jgi:hypothetical protein
MEAERTLLSCESANLSRQPRTIGEMFLLAEASRLRGNLHRALDLYKVVRRLAGDDHPEDASEHAPTTMRAGWVTIPARIDVLVREADLSGAGPSGVLSARDG